MELVKEFIDWSLKGFTSDCVYINEEIVMIDTLHTIDELKAEFGESDVKVIEVDKNGYDLVESNNFGLSTCKHIFEAIKTLDKSDDINYFLDLIASKGSIDLLTGKEKERLFELTKKVNPLH